MLKIVLIVALVYSLACGYLYAKQRALIFFPVTENNWTDAQFFWLETDQARLKIWEINEGKQAVIYFGGNAEAVEFNIPDFRPLLHDFKVYLVNYRGYGGSSGSPSEKALFEDALALYDALEKKYDAIHVVGRSLGSGVALFLAEQRKIGKIALITPYDSLRNLAQSHYPLFPVKWLLKDPFDSLLRAQKIDNQVLILIAEKDRIVPLKHSQRLINSLTQAQVESHIIQGADHNNITNPPETLSYLQTFLKTELTQ